MPVNPIEIFVGDGLIPAMCAEDALQQPIRLAASKTFEEGQLLGELIGNDEFQTLVIDATGGTFTITVVTTPSSALAYNASAAAVKSAIETALTTDEIDGSDRVDVFKRSTRWTLTEKASTDGGTFALAVTVNGKREIAAGLAWNISAANLTTALEALSNIGAGGVVASGSAGGPYTLTFIPGLGFSSLDPAGTLGPIVVEVINDLTLVSTAIAGITLAEKANAAYVVHFKNHLGNTNVAAATTGAGSLTGGASTATVATLLGGSAGTPGIFDTYDPTLTTGRAIPKCWLQHQCTTDSSKNISYGDAINAQQQMLSLPAYFNGIFWASDIVGLTEAALAKLGGRILMGSFAAPDTCLVKIQ